MIPNLDPQEVTHDVMYVMFCPSNEIYYDLTDRFPVKFSFRNQYTLLLYDYNSNTIHVWHLYCCQGSIIVAKLEDIYKILVSPGLQPKLMKLDNKTSMTDSVTY